MLTILVLWFLIFPNILFLGFLPLYHLPFLCVPLRLSGTKTFYLFFSFLSFFHSTISPFYVFLSDSPELKHFICSSLSCLLPLYHLPFLCVPLRLSGTKTFYLFFSFPRTLSVGFVWGSGDKRCFRFSQRIVSGMGFKLSLAGRISPG